MSTSGFSPNRAHWAPLSPPSPTSASTAVPKRNVGPINLPSSPAPSHSSVDAPTNLDALNLAGPTPPASVPMSAQQSQTSITDASSFGLTAKQCDRSYSGSLSPTKGMFDGQLRSISGSKRKNEEEDSASPSKRPKTEDAEKDQHPMLAQAAEAAPRPFFRVRSQPVVLSQPHSSLNLVELYGLEDVASSLARKDVHGEKINKLRKSYENYIKDVPGRDKIRKVDNELRHLSMYPDEDYHNTNIHGKELGLGLSDDIQRKLAGAARIDAGQLSGKEDKNWREIIDAESLPTKAQAPPLSSLKKGPEVSIAVPSPGLSGPESARPSRRGVKRRYNDESFEGYGDSFADDAVDAGSPDLGDDVDVGSTAKRKKRRDTASSPKINFSANTMSAVSIGSGGYAGR